MGYTIWYQGTSSSPITPDQLAMAVAHAAKWSGALSDSAEAYAWSVDSEDPCVISGWTKPGLDEIDMETDIETIVAAVTELDGQMEGVEFTVTDDYGSDHYP